MADLGLRWEQPGGAAVDVAAVRASSQCEGVEISLLVSPLSLEKVSERMEGVLQAQA